MATARTPAEDYVIALEYEEPVSASTRPRAPLPAPTHRFHVEHFRGQLGERVFVLVRDESTMQ